MVLIKKVFLLFFLCPLRMQGADLQEPLVPDLLDKINPHLESNSRFSSASNTPGTPNIPIWDKQALAYVIQKQKNDSYKKRKRALQVGTTIAALTTLTLNCFSEKNDFNFYAITTAALAVVCNIGSLCVDCLIDRNTTVNPILKPTDLIRADTQDSLEKIPEDM